ncbi:MAG: MoaD family protein, partial [Desulfurococcaceae archaeon]
MPRVVVKFFSIYSDVVNNIYIDVDEGSTIEDLISKLLTKYPDLKEIFENIKPIILINGSVHDSPVALKDGDEVAFIPPASGG